MIVAVNMSREVFEYYKEYDLSAIADTLLEIYDITSLPPTCGQRDVERKINVSDQFYLSLYKTYGPRSKKTSLGRLFEFGYRMDVLAMPRFKIFRAEKVDDPTFSLVDKAYKALLEAKKYDDSAELAEIITFVYDYREVVRNRYEA